MYYIRLLKQPRLVSDSKCHTVTAVLTVATDLGDTTFPSELPLLVSVVSANNREAVWKNEKIIWKSSLHSLTVTLSFGLASNPSKARIACSPFASSLTDVGCRGDQLVMPVIVPVFSEILAPDHGVIPLSFNRRMLDLSHERTLIICEEMSHSIAGHVWDAGYSVVHLLDKFFSHNLPFPSCLDQCLNLSNTGSIKVIELGTGTGLVGIALARMMPNMHVLLTDNEDIDCSPESVLASNIELNKPAPGSSVFFDALDWQKSAVEDLSSLQFDLIVAADCIYNADSSPALVETINAIERSAPNALVMIAAKRRHSDESIFFEKMRESQFHIVNELRVLLSPGVEEDNVRECSKIDIVFFRKTRQI